jgi:fucose permease
MEQTHSTATANDAAVMAGLNPRKLFILGCLCLATTSASFILRTSIAQDLQTQLFEPINKLTSAAMVGDGLKYAFLGFAFTVAIGSALVDFMGMRNMLTACGLSFIVGTLLTVTAGGDDPGTPVKLGMFLNGLGWGFSETVINPLTTAIYPNDKTHRLNVLHAWWPAGIVFGGILGLGIDQLALGWRIKFGMMLIPATAILLLLIGTKFPKTERVASGVSTSDMFKECSKPGFLIWFLAMFLTASAELAPGQWVDLALTHTVGMRGVWLMIYVSGLMFVMRHFAGTMVRKFSLVGLLWISSLLAALGLFWLSYANSPITGLLGATVWGVGVCYMWPTMLAAAAERHPKSGALGMGLIGSAGSLAIWFVLPEMGKIFDTNKIAAAGSEGAYKALEGSAKEVIDAAAAADSFRVVAILPAILLIVFGAIWLNDKRKGGVKAEPLATSQTA